MQELAPALRVHDFEVAATKVMRLEPGIEEAFTGRVAARALRGQI